MFWIDTNSKGNWDVYL